MNIFIFWIASSIMSLSMEFINELRLFKVLADCGYLINLKRLEEFSNLNPDDTSDKNLFLSLMTPILNFATVFRRTQMINQFMPILVDQFCVTGCVDEMTEEERKEYKKHPTVLKAVVLSMKRDIKTMMRESRYKENSDNKSVTQEQVDIDSSKEDTISDDKNSLYRQQLSQYKKLLERERDELIEQKNNENNDEKSDETKDKVLKK